MKKTTTASEMESKITQITNMHRKKAYETAEMEMYEAFKKIAGILKESDNQVITRRGINGLSEKSLKEILRLADNGATDFELERAGGRISKDTHLAFMIEFLKVRSMTFEATRIKYPNYLKPWTEEDDQELEELWCEGASVEELGEHFKRNAGAIKARIEKLELQEKYSQPGTL